jgi:aspartate/methionine/tyrosine aminotransferase
MNEQEQVAAMPGVFSDLDLSPNPLELVRLKAAVESGYVDLTSSNPTQQGLLFPPEVLRTAADDYWQARRYTPDPRGLPAARAAIVEYYVKRNPPLTLPLEAITITASTSEAYSLLFALLADPGDNMLAPNVTYPLFDYLAALRGVELRPYTLDERCGWQIDEDSLLAQADARTRAVLLISPHNPTGAIIQRPLPALTRLGVPLICDEVFAPFTYRVPTVPPLATLHPELPVFMLNGISKMFALPDLKLGWVALNPQALADYGERLELLNDTFLGASSLIQHMLPALFVQGQAFIETMVKRVQNNFELAQQQLATCTTLELQAPDGGYYLFPAVRGWDDEEALVLFLLRQGVLVHPGFFYGEVPDTHIMLSALTEPERFAQGIAQVRRALQ